MATEIANTSSLGSTLSGVANLTNLFLGSTSTQSGTTTNSGGTTVSTNETSVSPDAVNALVNSILSGSQGLAAVSSGQKGAGLYNSSTNTLLSNDLVARAAAEGAKLNQKTTQTTVTPQTTQTTAQTLVKEAPVSAGAAGIGGLALAGLSLIPKDIKDNFTKNGISSFFGSKAAGGATDTAGDAASSISDGIKVSDPTGNGDFGFNATTGAALAGDGAQSVAGFDPSNIGANLADAGDEAGDAIQNIAGLSGGSNTGDDIADASGGLGEALGGFLSGAGDQIASAAGDLFSDFDFTMADGGVVSSKNYKDARAKHAAMKDIKAHMADGGTVQAGRGNGENIFEATRRKREEDAGLVPSAGAPEVLQQGLVPTTPAERQSVFNLINSIPALLNSFVGSNAIAAPGKADGGIIHMANGGSVSSALDDGNYDLSGINYIANTGVRASGPKAFGAQGAESNDVMISKIIRDQSRVLGGSGAAASSTGQTPNSNDASVAGYNSSSGEVSGGANSNPGSATEGAPGGVSSIGGLTGLSDSVAGKATSALGSIAGISGISGLAGANSPGDALGSVAGTALGMMNPALGIAFSIARAISASRDAATAEAARSAAQESFSQSEHAEAAAASNNESTGDLGYGFSSDGGVGGGNTGNSGMGGGIGGSGNSAGTGEGGSGRGGGYGSSASAANGGHIQGPGTGTSDSIPTMLSDGEYVLPADMVAAIGVDKLDAWKAQLHTPAATQRNSANRAPQPRST